ncbi:MAG: prepilin-type N-terminal cleavage/methylation domain-containing protein [Phycisphaeraceae bacterium]|nr:prepilin-type N-terminal cleavage/methylation domain-containing protein [Phycisphaerales bacterium]MCB9860107.1 prepilin-type N-terminal cleavage/methylation domain-containing protein [Phycisphaeraceae bacterium]
MNRSVVRKQARKAFTLVEILIVVVILGILAAIVIPQFTDASDQANAASQDSMVQTLQSQVELYRAQTGAYPADLAALVTAGYMRSVPNNPVTGAAYTYTAATGLVAP